MQPRKAWGNLDNITLEPLRTFYNVTLGTLREPLQYNLGNLGKLGNLQGTLQEPWGYLLETVREPWQSNLGNLIETFTMSPWEPGPRLLGNLYIMILGTLTTFTWKTWEPCREPWRNLEGTFWEPWGNLEEPWEPWGNLGNLYWGTFTWEPGNLYLGTWEPLLGNLYFFTWEPLLFWLGNLYLEPGNLGGIGFGALKEPWGNLLGTLREPWGNLEEPWEPEGTLGTWEPLLGNLGTFTWEPGNLYLGTFYLGTFTWEPLLGNLYLGTFTWEPLLGTWEPWGNRFWSCSGLLRNLYYGWRPQSILLLGKKVARSLDKT